MTRPASARRLLQTNSGQFPAIPAADPPDPLAVDSDVVVILAALLCALICVVGLAAVARCARSRRSTNSAASTGGGRGPDATSAGAPNKGLKKKALKALPKLAYEDAVAAVAAARGGGAGEETLLAECPICLSEFGEEEEIRILPQCGHGFHVACVDTWLGAHSSCPSCRRVLVVDPPKATPRPPPTPTPTPKQCRKGDATGTSSTGSGGAASSFLP